MYTTGSPNPRDSSSPMMDAQCTDGNIYSSAEGGDVMAESDSSRFSNKVEPNIADTVVCADIHEDRDSSFPTADHQNSQKQYPMEPACLVHIHQPKKHVTQEETRELTNRKTNLPPATLFSDIYVKSKGMKDETRRTSGALDSPNSIQIGDITPICYVHSKESNSQGQTYAENSPDASHDQLWADNGYSSSMMSSLVNDNDVETPCREQLRTLYSPEIRQLERMTISQSLDALNLSGNAENQRHAQVLDKLISSSISRTELASAQRRRLSWTPDSTSQYSSGSVPDISKGKCFLFTQH